MKKEVYNEVSEETLPDGKKKYSNETKRSDEMDVRLSNDMDYQAHYGNREALKKEIELLRIDTDALKRIVELQLWVIKTQSK